MAWVMLILAGIFEVGFAISMKLMDGHRHVGWSISFYACIVLSLIFLEQAMRTIPLGTAYAVWTGIGGIGVATVGIAFFGDPVTVARMVFLSLIVVALVGLKLTAAT